MAKLRIAPSAQDDLRGIRIYSKAAFGPTIARDYMKGFRGVFALLREQPFAGASQDDLGVGVRKFSYRSHAVYYRVSGDEVTIARIFHSAQDAPTRLRS